MNSWSAKCLAVRKVTQDNRGKKTAGIDGVKSLTPKQRLYLVNNLKLEPEWEAKFEPNSYGFRPGRSCHDAVEAIFKSISSKDKYVLDADIANVALHGLETAIRESFPESTSINKVAHLTYIKLIRWAKRRHPNKSMKWIHQRYWLPGEVRWNFGVSDGKRLLKHSEIPTRKHINVQGSRSPYDGDWSYWATRMGKHPDLPVKKAKLLQMQKGKCARCGLYFQDGDMLEVDHIKPKAQGGKDQYNNMQLLHRHCHDQKTRGETPLTIRSTHDKSQIIEEPYEAKVSRTDLKTSKRGNELA